MVQNESLSYANLTQDYRSANGASLLQRYCAGFNGNPFSVLSEFKASSKSLLENRLLGPLPDPQRPPLPMGPEPPVPFPLGGNLKFSMNYSDRYNGYAV